MLSRELVSAVLSILPTRALDKLGDPRQQAFQRALAPLLNRPAEGAVQARFADGSFMVKVADTAARMQLPPGTTVGSNVQMTLVSLHPRPTFQVGTPAQGALAEAAPPPQDGADPASTPLAYREGAAAGQAALGRAAPLSTQLQDAPPQARAQANNTEVQHTQLSRTGQTLANVLAAADKAPAPLTTLVGRAPVVSTPDTPPPQLAANLAKTVDKSGLFYESHVAQWAQGERALAELASEPQHMAARQGQPPQPLEPATAQFINLQLATQEQAHLSWQGQLWPGQDMQWDVEREAGGDADDPEQAIWNSRLRLRFAHLGELDVRLRLVNGALQVDLATPSADTAALLRTETAALADALDAAGTPLAGFDAHATPAAQDRHE